MQIKKRSILQTTLKTFYFAAHKCYNYNMHNIKAVKAGLRRQMANIRQNAADRDVQDKLIWEITLAFCQGFNEIFVYHSFGSEVDTRNIISALLQADKTVYLPRIDSGNMVAVQCNNSTEFTRGQFGILEPKGIAEKRVGKIEICLCPGLVFSLKGQRLGYGKGYYDRFLQGLKIVKAGLCYDFQLLEDVPANDFDVLMDYIITAKGVFGTH